MRELVNTGSTYPRNTRDVICSTCLRTHAVIGIVSFMSSMPPRGLVALLILLARLWVESHRDRGIIHDERATFSDIIGIWTAAVSTQLVKPNRGTNTHR